MACMAFALALSLALSSSAQSGGGVLYLDPDAPLERRVDDLVSRLTLEEKVSLMKHTAPAIPRLGIPAYNWWNEALHGVACTAENVTSFPQAIGLAATFDEEALAKMADMVSSEGRALFNEALRNGEIPQYYGLTYWTPNINIFRDPRWGRGHETYGEDPYLTGRMGMAMVRGLEGSDSHYLKAVACAKHFAVHSGPEGIRHSFDALPSDFDLWDTYLPAFRDLVTKANVHGVMGAYNRFRGEPCCANPFLFNILRNQWDFDGYVTSDCWAINDFVSFHKTHDDYEAAASAALLAGVDMECGELYPLLADGVRDGLLAERDINVAVKRLMTILFKLGMFDPQERVPYSSIGREVIECEAHKEHAALMARESIVLLRNERNTLPLDVSKIRRVALVGPNADNEKTLLANYYGVPSEVVTPYEALRKRLGDRVTVDYIQGVGMVGPLDSGLSFKEIASRAGKADVIIFVGGISADYEGEAGDAGTDGCSGFSDGDRTTMALPQVQTDLLKALKKTGRPLVLVNMSGSVMSLDWESRNVDAILQAWYGGQAAGEAITDVLFGDYNPAGRMPLTTYVSDADLPPFDDYSMEGRTYRYFDGPVRYPFGYGLSYTEFSYGKPERVSGEIRTGESVVVSATVKNVGGRDGDEVAQLYVRHPREAGKRVPLLSLKGFERIHLKAGEEKTVSFTLSPEDLALVRESGSLVESAGEVEIFIGGGQPGHTPGNSLGIKLTGREYQVF